MLRSFAIGGSALLLWQLFSAADAARVQALVTSVGIAGVVLIALPQLLALGLESYAWKRAFDAGIARPRWRSLLRVRLATEALAQSLPLGVAFAESIKPALLARHAGLSVDQSVAGMAARKVLLLLSQSIYVVALATLGFAGLEAVSRPVLGMPHLGLLTLGLGLVLGAAGLLAVLLLRRSRLAAATLRMLTRLPHARLARWLRERERSFLATDGRLAEFFSADPRRLLPSLAAFTAAWLIEAVETWLILFVLGVPVSFATAGGLEVVLSLVRNIVFVVPAGLGLQDLGYVAGFTGFGLPEAASLGAAFVVLKRGKELFWIGVGYALLGGDLSALLRRPAARGRRVPLLSPARA
jgi:uncharacterized membrane protein YbhN (UPF0104 family)